MNIDERLAVFGADEASPTTSREARSRARFHNLLTSTGESTPSEPRWWPVRSKLPLGIAAAAVALSVGAGVTTLVLNDQTSPPHHIALGEALKQFPEATASDVVTWSDAVVVATVVKSAPAEETLGRGELEEDPLVNRSVTLKLNSIEWQRKGTTDVPEEFQMLTWGWIVDDDGREEFSTEGDVVLREGHTYLVPVAFDGSTWGYRGAATFEVSGERVQVAEGQDTELAGQLTGATLSDARDLLAAAKPDPAVRPYLELPIRERYQAVQQANRQGG